MLYLALLLGSVQAAPDLSTTAEVQARIQGTHAKVHRAVAAIMDPGPSGGEEAATATIVSADGFALTAAHCLEDPGTVVKLKLHDGRIVEAETLGKERALDFGLLKITAKGPFDFVTSKRRGTELVADEVVLMYGYPDGGEEGRRAVVRLGTFLGVRSDGMVRSSCAMMPGDSGGPLFDLNGELVGINSEIDLPLDQNYHVDAGAAMASWERLVAGEVWGKDPFEDWYGGPEDEGFEDGFGNGFEGGEELSTEEVRAELRVEMIQEAEERAADQAAPRDPGPNFDPAMQLAGGRAGLLESMTPAAATASASTVRITSRQGESGLTALGIAVGSGSDAKNDVGSLVVSKSSRIGADALRCQLPDGTLDTAEVVFRDPKMDLVLLRMRQSTLPAAPLAEPSVGAPPLGSFLAAAAPSLDSGALIGAGLLGSNLHATRRRAYGYLGVVLTGRLRAQPVVESVEPSGAAANAGVLGGDVIVGFGGHDIAKRSEFRARLRNTNPGQAVTLVVRREDRKVDLELVLGVRPDMAFEETGHVAYLTETSARRGSFTDVFRHDTHVERDDCGGPLVDLSGSVVGLNIARADRTGSLAFPPSALRSFVRRALAAQRIR